MDIETWAKNAEKKPVQTLINFLLVIFCVGCLFSGFGHVFGWIGDTAQVVKEEVSPRALLTKYEWFKDASATLDKKYADIAIYESRIQEIHTAYSIEGITRSQYDRGDKEQMNVWASEVAGIRASYNQLAAEYNSNMAQFHKSLANVGQMPKRANEINKLPHSYKPYL